MFYFAEKTFWPPNTFSSDSQSTERVYWLYSHDVYRSRAYDAFASALEEPLEVVGRREPLERWRTGLCAPPHAALAHDLPASPAAGAARGPRRRHRPHVVIVTHTAAICWCLCETWGLWGGDSGASGRVCELVRPPARHQEHLAGPLLEFDRRQPRNSRTRFSRRRASRCFAISARVVFCFDLKLFCFTMVEVAVPEEPFWGLGLEARPGNGPTSKKTISLVLSFVLSANSAVSVDSRRSNASCSGGMRIQRRTPHRRTLAKLMLYGSTCANEELTQKNDNENSLGLLNHNTINCKIW